MSGYKSIKYWSEFRWYLRFFKNWDILIVSALAIILDYIWLNPIDLGINAYKLFLILVFQLTWSGSPYTESNPVSHLILSSFATNLLEGGYDIRIVQELFGHNDVKTEMIYTHPFLPLLFLGKKEENMAGKVTKRDIEILSFIAEYKFLTVK